MSCRNEPVNSYVVFPGDGMVSPASHQVAGTSIVVVSGVACRWPSTI